MTSGRGARPATAELSDHALAEGLIAGAVGECWSERAAVRILVGHGGWLGRPALRRAVMTELGLDGELFAWVVWGRVDVTGATASAREFQVLTLACSLGGVSSDRPLSDLLFGLDVADTSLVLNAIWLACTGHALSQSRLK